MKDFMIILAFMAVVLGACDSKEETKECDSSVASSTDVASTPDVDQGNDATVEDAATAADAAGLSDILSDGFPNVSDADDKAAEAKACYDKCVKSDMSKEDCKKACYGDWTKDDNCETCYNKCVKAGKSKLECKEGCCEKKSDPKETDATSTPDDVSETTD